MSRKPTLVVEYDGLSLPCRSVDDGADLWCAYRDENGLGARDCAGAVVRDDDENLVARIAYNGTIIEAGRREGEVDTMPKKIPAAPLPTTVWVVQETHGMYSDKTERPLCFYYDRAAAEEHARQAQEGAARAVSDLDETKGGA